mgnify:CR=1 FL=1|jgi:hypothetical protein
MVSLIKKKKSSNKTNKKRKSNFKKTGRRTKMSNKKSLRRNRMKHGGEFDDNQTIETLKQIIAATELKEPKVIQLKTKILKGFIGKVHTIDALDMLISTFGIAKFSLGMGSGTSCKHTSFNDVVFGEPECRLDKVILYSAIKKGVEDIKLSTTVDENVKAKATYFLSTFDSTFNKATENSEANPVSTKRLTKAEKDKQYWAQISKHEVDDMNARLDHKKSEQVRKFKERHLNNSA